MVEIDHQYNHGHLPGCLSALPTIADIYAKMDLSHDVFILSKGHACAAWYAVLEKYGYHPDVSKVHPDIDPANGIPCTTGSLGHGLPIAVGMALAKRIKDEIGTVYVLLGDGECLEGTTWESLLLADQLELSNLQVIVDYNGWQGSGEVVCNRAVSMAVCLLNSARLKFNRKGIGLMLFEAHRDWHVHHLTDAEYNQIMEELQ